MEGIIIHLYTLCWNEINILPFVIDYWKDIPVTKAIVYDNGSTDGSIEFLQQYDWIEVRHFDSDGMNDDIQKQIKNSCWKESKGVADYVIVCDMDEVLWSCHWKDVLEFMKDNRCNVLATPWYALCGDSMPEHSDGVLLHKIINKVYKQEINRQYKDIGKFMLFNPNEIEEMNYSVGCHIADVKPKLSMFETKRVYAIHFDKGFGVDYFIHRRKLMNNRLSETNRNNGWCYEYGFSEEKIREEYKKHQNESINILDVMFPPILSTWTFGHPGWRIESHPSEGKSNLKLYANDELIFEGTYGDLIRKINKG